MSFRGVILDVDGTLVDSNDAHAHAFVEALAAHGYDVPFERVRRLIGMGADKLVPEVTGLAPDDPQVEAISKQRSEMFKSKYLPDLRAFPHTRDLLQRMREAGLKLVVGSSAKSDELEPLLRVAGATDLIESQTSSSDAENSKPEPDILEVALDRLGYPPHAVVMLGDTPYDLEAARKAGVPMIALRSGGWGTADFPDTLRVYDDPADLLAHWAQSPLAH